MCGGVVRVEGMLRTTVLRAGALSFIADPKDDRRTLVLRLIQCCNRGVTRELRSSRLNCVFNLGCCPPHLRVERDLLFGIATGYATHHIASDIIGKVMDHYWPSPALEELADRQEQVNEFLNKIVDQHNVTKLT